MPRAREPARLWLSPARAGRKAVWLILDNGRQRSTGCGQDDRRGAEAALAAYIGQRHDPAAHGRCRRASETPVSDVLAVYAREVVPGQRDPAKAGARMDSLLDFWGERMLSDVTPETCRAYVAHRATAPIVQRSRPRKNGGVTERIVRPAKPRSGGGARRDLEDLRAAVEHHAQRELHSGVVRVTLPPKGKARTKYLTADEVARLLWVCWRHKRPQVPPRGPRAGQRIIAKEDIYDLRHLARFILMGVYTGTRSGSILKASLRRGEGRAWVDLDNRMFFRLPEDQVEADNKRYPAVRIPGSLAAHIRRWRDKGLMREHVVEWGGRGSPRPVASIKTAWARAVALAGIEGRPTPHTLRHTAVSWLKQQGTSSFDAGRFVGMSERMVEEVYGHHDPDYQRATADSLSYGRRRTRAGRVLRN